MVSKNMTNETNNDVTAVNVRDISFNLNTSNRSLSLCARMNYETENLDFIDTLSEGEVLYDLGACEGRLTIYAKLKGIKTYSFEPDQDNYQMLVNNLKLNKLSEEDAFEIALGNKNEKQRFKIGQPWPGGHQKVVANDYASRNDLNFVATKETEVNVVKLDDFISENQLSFPNYMKIDIDGSELSFLNGALTTMADNRLKGLLFELNVNDINYSQIIEILKKCNFSEIKRFSIPNESDIFNIWFTKD